MILSELTLQRLIINQAKDLTIGLHVTAIAEKSDPLQQHDNIWAVAMLITTHSQYSVDFYKLERV